VARLKPGTNFRPAALVTACLLTACVHVPEQTATVSRGMASGAALETAFTVVVWNVHKEPGAFEGELPGLVPNPDLVLLQEGLGPTVGPPLSSSGQATHVVSFRMRHGGEMTGVSTWSWAQASEEVPLRTRTREPLVGTPKSALLSFFAIEVGTTLAVVNLHGINIRAARHLEAQLHAIEAAIGDHTGPLIVAGDFNTWSKARVAAVERFAQRLGLGSVFRGAEAPKLDGVWVRGLQVEDARVVDTRHSDHDALVVRLRVDVA